MNNQSDIRPICGMCVVFKTIRPRMYEESPGRWRCPVCDSLTINPTDPDETAKDLAVMFRESTPEEIRARDERLAEVYDRSPRVYHRGPVEFKGESKGKKTKKPMKPTPWYNSPFGRPY